MTLLPTWTLGDLELTSYPFAVEFGGDHGAPETISELVTSMLGDGDLVRQTRHGNREISIVVQVEGPTLGVLAENEAALRAECSKPRNLLTFQPGDIDSPASVFEVLVIAMRQPRNDDHEQQMIRRWELTLTCAPFARSVEPTTVAALPAPGAPVTFTISNADTTTGWSAAVSGGPSPSVIDGGDYVTASSAMPPPLGYRRWSLSLTVDATPVNMTTTPYVRIETNGSGGSLVEFLQVKMDGTWTTVVPVLSQSVTGSTFRAHFVDVRSLGTTLSGVRVSRSADQPATLSVSVRDVTRTNTLAQVSPRQVTRFIEVGGTERTPASLHAFTGSGFLGRTIVHTTPADGSGYTPDLRRWGYSGSDTTPNVDSRFITGTWEALQPASLVARRPADSVPPGDYILMAAMRSSATGERAISYAVKSILAGSTVVGNVTGTTYYSFEVANRMEYVPIAVVAAPIVRSEGALDLEVHLSNPSPGATSLYVEEWWLFADGPDSALSILGTDEAEMWLESPDVDNPVPRVWVGNANGRFHPNTRLQGQGSHTFQPGRMQVTTISDANDYLEVDLSYFKRWHSNAVE